MRGFAKASGDTGILKRTRPGPLPVRRSKSTPGPRNPCARSLERIRSDFAPGGFGRRGRLSVDSAKSLDYRLNSSVRGGIAKW